MMKLCILGGGGYGKTVADIAKCQNSYEDVFFLDDADIKKCGEYLVIGKLADYIKYIDDSEFIVAIGENHIRKAIIEKLLKRKVKLTTLIHPKSVVASDVKIEPGCVIMAGVVVNSGSEIGTGAILNTCCSVDHDNKIGKYCHISVGAHLAGTVEVNDCAFVGAGATVKNNVKICADTIVGAGAVVVKDIAERGTYIGVPAKKMKI